MIVRLLGAIEFHKEPATCITLKQQDLRVLGAITTLKGTLFTQKHLKYSTFYAVQNIRKMMCTD